MKIHYHASAFILIVILLLHLSMVPISFIIIIFTRFSINCRSLIEAVFLIFSLFLHHLIFQNFSLFSLLFLFISGMNFNTTRRHSHFLLLSNIFLLEGFHLLITFLLLQLVVFFITLSGHFISFSLSIEIFVRIVIFIICISVLFLLFDIEPERLLNIFSIIFNDTNIFISLIFHFEIRISSRLYAMASASLRFQIPRAGRPGRRRSPISRRRMQRLEAVFAAFAGIGFSWSRFAAARHHFTPPRPRRFIACFFAAWVLQLGPVFHEAAAEPAITYYYFQLLAGHFAASAFSIARNVLLFTKPVSLKPLAGFFSFGFQYFHFSDASFRRLRQ